MASQVTGPFQLWSIRFSHFCEKVRWGMDRLRIPYIENPLLPGMHWLVTPWVIRGKSAADQQSTKFSTPIIRTDRGETLSKSDHILQYLDARFSAPSAKLYSSSEAAELEQRFNHKLGPTARRFAYFEMLERPDLLRRLARANVGRAQAMLFTLSMPLIIQLLKKGLNINRESARRARETILTEFAEAEKRLRDGRPYLCGDSFSIADLTFCSLGGVLLMPSPAEGFGAKLPELPNDCIELNRLATQLRDSDVGKWVLDRYRLDRGSRQIPCLPLIA